MTIKKRNNLVLKNRGLVHTIIGRTKDNRMGKDKLDELAQYGYLGLMKAVEKFDPSYGLSFSTYAFPYITSYIRWGLYENNGVVGGIMAKKKRKVESVSLNKEVYEGYEVQDSIMDNNYEDKISQIEDRLHIIKLLDKLEERDRNIIRYKYGLDDGIERTLQETGNKFGFSRQRAEQIEKKILEKIRRNSHV